MGDGQRGAHTHARIRSDFIRRSWRGMLASARRLRASGLTKRNRVDARARSNGEWHMATSMTRQWIDFCFHKPSTFRCDFVEMDVMRAR